MTKTTLFRLTFSLILLISQISFVAATASAAASETFTYYMCKDCPAIPQGIRYNFSAEKSVVKPGLNYSMVETVPAKAAKKAPIKPPPVLETPQGTQAGCPNGVCTQPAARSYSSYPDTRSYYLRIFRR